MIKRITDRIFKGFCDPACYDDIQGDLNELYARQLREGDGKSASWKHFWRVAMLFRPSVIRPIVKNSKLNNSMIANYFKIGSRNLVRQKVFTVINVAGLAFGLTAFLIIQSYINIEKSYDNFHDDADQLYRVSTIYMQNDVVDGKDAMVTYQLPAQIVAENPSALDFTTSLKLDPIPFKKSNSFVYEHNVISADSNFLDLFTYEVLRGDKKTMLSTPNTLVFTASKAEAYFGDQDPIGQVVEISGEYEGQYKVTGVIEDVPENTHYKFDVLISDPTMEVREDYNEKNWNNYYGYLKLEKNADVAELNGRMKDLSDRIYGAENNSDVFFIHPVQDIHLHSDYTYEAEIPGSYQTINFLNIIAYFILIIAWVNYINLTTAKSVERAKEVGLRKVIGAQRWQLTSQFLIEAGIVNMAAVLLSLLLLVLLQPFFNDIAGIKVLTNFWENVYILKTIAFFIVFGTLFTGFYPALVLSSFKPIAVLKGKFKNSGSGILLRKTLVLVQFSISIVMIGGTLIVIKQVNYIGDIDKGIDIDYVVGIKMPKIKEGEDNTENANAIKAFMDQLKTHSAIKYVGSTSNLPGGDGADINSTNTQIKVIGKTDWVHGLSYVQFNDPEFVLAVNMNVIAGRNFDAQRDKDKMVLMVNEAYVKKMNIAQPEDIIGQTLLIGSDEGDRFEIVGVVNDFYRTSAKASIEPTIYVPRLNQPNAVVALHPDNYLQGMDYVKSTWAQHYPDSPLSYTFLSERFEKLYVQERRFGRMFTIFAFLAIIIAGLGLFGLSSFLSLQRTKEVGIRKVLGASTPEIVINFFRGFASLLIVAAIIGIPAIYFGMSMWLDNYATRIAFPWINVVLSVFLIMLMAFVIIGFQVYKVAMLNPAKTLKYE